MHPLNTIPSPRTVPSSRAVRDDKGPARRRCVLARDRETAASLVGEFDLSPAGIVHRLDLLRPIDDPTADGRFGRDDLDLPWGGVAPAADPAKPLSLPRPTARGAHAS